ncbi:MAG: hypothetical protein NC548_46895 [Lachnospiraceae bacterium]|nr:hypothetical protein [Lachnospiraceae bacterium]
MAVSEVVLFFNVGKNMNASQIALVTDMILEKFWYLRVEEIKSCFREKMFSAKIYDRLDGNIILGWLREYDLERDQLMEQINIDEKNLIENSTPEPSGDGVSYEDYIEGIKQKVEAGEEGAEEQLEIAMKFKAMHFRSPEDKKKKDEEFKRWYREVYLPNKHKQESQNEENS